MRTILSVALSLFVAYMIFTNFGAFCTAVMYVVGAIVAYLVIMHILGTPFSFTVNMGGVEVEKRIYRRFRRVQ